MFAPILVNFQTLEPVAAVLNAGESLVTYPPLLQRHQLTVGFSREYKL